MEIFKMKQTIAQWKNWVAELIEEITEAMDFEKTDWRQLSENQLEKIGRINCYRLDEVDIKRMYKDGVITPEQMKTINSFCEWDQRLGY